MIALNCSLPRMACSFMLALATFLQLEGVAHGQGPQVHFDLVPLVACRDVTPFSFSEANPSERLVEARITVSALLRRGAPADLIEYQFTFSSPERNLSIADYGPKTALATDIAGTIHTENNAATSQSAGLNLSLKYDRLSAGGASVGGEQKQGTLVKFDKLPPLELVSAAGTYDRGRAVYIKLRPTPRTTLEGTHEFLLQLRVPQAWRGDYLHVRCAAVGVKRGSMKQFDERASAGDATFLVALHALGDSGAKTAAQKLLATEQELQQRAADRRREIEKAAYANNQAKKLAILFDLAEPKVPGNWLAQVLFGATGSDAPDFAWRLPSDVVAAISEFTTAKLELHRLCGQ